MSYRGLTMVSSKFIQTPRSSRGVLKTHHMDTAVKPR
ncbi:MAG: palindromic element RPE4 domain-containing protein [Gammaproteobacteria bacterium]|nr:palindromic element RPE4 domain-containing protein [Gammaproteobacteria bacterium]